jgi:DNA-binding beta-propeller fold protein YncE
VGAGPHDVVITSDDALALVMTGDGSVRVIDLATQTLEAQSISGLGQAAMGSLAVAPDPRWAFVATYDTSEVWLIDVAARTSTQFEPLAGTGAYYCAMSPDGSALVVLANPPGDPIVLF